MTDILGDSVAQFSSERAAVHPYEKVLLRSDCDRVVRLGEKLRAKLDDVFHVSVQNCGDFERKAHEKPKEKFTLRIKSAIPIGELRDIIQKKYNDLGYFDLQQDPPLRLVFAGQTLVDGTKLNDYSIQKKRSQWPTPYAGVIWVVPFHVEPNYKRLWGSSMDSEDQKVVTPAERQK